MVDLDALGKNNGGTDASSQPKPKPKPKTKNKSKALPEPNVLSVDGSDDGDAVDPHRPAGLDVGLDHGSVGVGARDRQQVQDLVWRLGGEEILVAVFI